MMHAVLPVPQPNRQSDLCIAWYECILARPAVWKGRDVYKEISFEKVLAGRGQTRSFTKDCRPLPRFRVTVCAA